MTVTIPIPTVPQPYNRSADEKVAWRTGYRVGIKGGGVERIDALYPQGDSIQTRRRLAAFDGYFFGVLAKTTQEMTKCD